MEVSLAELIIYSVACVSFYSRAPLLGVSVYVSRVLEYSKRYFAERNLANGKGGSMSEKHIRPDSIESKHPVKRSHRRADVQPSVSRG
jgi:hypothetical protein